MIFSPEYLIQKKKDGVEKNQLYQLTHLNQTNKLPRHAKLAQIAAASGRCGENICPLFPITENKLYQKIGRFTCLKIVVLLTGSFQAVLFFSADLNRNNGI